MKKQIRILCLLFLCLPFFASAQKLNFQGKIYYLGAPINGSAIIKFEMPSLYVPAFGSSWFEIDTVNVYNGLYSTTIGDGMMPLPNNVFDATHDTRDMVIRYLGNPIDTITIFAPLERDPNLGSTLTDSVFWSNVRNKPTVDTSFSNELQGISRNGDTIFLSKDGGYVLAPIGYDTSNTNEIQTISRSHDTIYLSKGGGYAVLPSFSTDTFGTTMDGTFTVINSTPTSLTGSDWGTTTTITRSPGQGIWQSFVATGSGRLNAIRVRMGSSYGAVQVNLYHGEGVDIGPAFFTYSGFATAASLSVSERTIDMLSCGTDIYLDAGRTYTFLILPVSTSERLSEERQDNTYANGISGFCTYDISSTALADNDLVFTIDVDHTNPSCLKVDNNCRVGIGTNTPTAQLEVKGRIKDQSGFIMPVGTILAYAGKISSIPEGWLECDGRALPISEYRDLYDAIGVQWGGYVNMFNIPDLRGRFLRGLDNSSIWGPSSSNNDPERTARYPINYGGNSGNNVGTLQGDQVGPHTHPLSPNNAFMNNDGTSNGCDGGDDVKYTRSYISVQPNSGNESRPRNAAVIYLIKY